MFRTILAVASIITLGFVGAITAQPPSATKPSTPTRTILQRADIPGTGLELVYATMEIPAGAKTERHMHPGVSMGQIVEGEVWQQFDGQPKKILRAGESSIIPANTVHEEGSTGKSAKLSWAYAVEKGKPLAIPAP